MKGDMYRIAEHMNSVNCRPFIMEAENSKRRQVPDFRVWLDYGMAALMVFFGVFIVFSEKILGYDYFEDSWLVTGGMKWAIGIMFGLYGAFRAYRGYLLSQRRKSEED
jgi:hypothetical protein